MGRKIRLRINHNSRILLLTRLGIFIINWESYYRFDCSNSIIITTTFQRWKREETFFFLLSSLLWFITKWRRVINFRIKDNTNTDNYYLLLDIKIKEYRPFYDLMFRIHLRPFLWNGTWTLITSRSKISIVRKPTKQSWRKRQSGPDTGRAYGGFRNGIRRAAGAVDRQALRRRRQNGEKP